MEITRHLSTFSQWMVIVLAYSPLLLVGAGCKPPPVPVAKENRQPESKKPEASESESKAKPPAAQPSGSHQGESEPSGSKPAKQSPSVGQASPDGKGNLPAQTSGAPKGKLQSGIGSTAGGSSPDSARRGKAVSPEQAAKGAEELFGVAKKEKDRGDATAAFETAVRAWELASEFPEDKKCSEIVGELNSFIEQQSSAVNRKAGAESRTRRNGKPLIVK